MTRMHSAITLKAAMNVNARKDSRVMDITTVQVINMFHLYAVKMDIRMCKATALIL